MIYWLHSAYSHPEAISFERQAFDPSSKFSCNVMNWLRNRQKLTKENLASAHHGGASVAMRCTSPRVHVGRAASSSSSSVSSFPSSPYFQVVGQGVIYISTSQLNSSGTLLVIRSKQYKRSSFEVCGITCLRSPSNIFMVPFMIRSTHTKWSLAFDSAFATVFDSIRHCCVYSSRLLQVQLCWVHLVKE